MTSPYRSASPPERSLRPLEPEDEIRLILARASWSRKARGTWGVYIFTILGVAYLVALGVAYGLEAFHPLAPLGALYFFLPALSRFESWYSFRRQLARLREQGYDVSELEQKPRVAVEPRIRVHAPSDLRRLAELCPRSALPPLPREKERGLDAHRGPRRLASILHAC